MFTIEQEEHGEVLILRYEGDMTLAEAVSLRHSLENILRETSAQDVVLDLHEVAQVDSSGLGMLVSVHTMARTISKRLMLHQVPQHVVDLLAQTGINDFFPTLDSEDDLWWRTTHGEPDVAEQA